MAFLNLIIILFLIQTAYSEFTLYQITSDLPLAGKFRSNQSITLSCQVDLSRGGQTDVIWYRRLGKVWQVIGHGDYLNNFFYTSRYILTRESMTKMEIVYTMVIKNLMVEDSGAIYCSGYKQLPESLTPFILNINNDPESIYHKCMSKEMSSQCASDILTRESNYSAMQRACIAIAVCLAFMLLVALILTILVMKRDCAKEDIPISEPNTSYNSNLRINGQSNNDVTPRSIMKTNRADFVISEQMAHHQRNAPLNERTIRQTNGQPKSVNKGFSQINNNDIKIVTADLNLRNELINKQWHVDMDMTEFSKSEHSIIYNSVTDVGSIV